MSKHYKILGIDYATTGHCSRMIVFGVDVYQRAGRVFSIFGLVIRWFK